MKNNESMIQAATKALEEAGKALTFPELWAKVCAAMEFTEEEAKRLIGKFYADLSFAGDIVLLIKSKTWDLRSRHELAEYHISPTNAYQDVEESGDMDQADIQEEAAYNQSVYGIVGSSEEEEEIDEESGESTALTREREEGSEALGIKKSL